MQDPLVLGGVLFGLLVAPFLSYAALAWLARRDLGTSRGREERTPSTTGGLPSRTIPGGGRREE